jgi:hypothetical protein
MFSTRGILLSTLKPSAALRETLCGCRRVKKSSEWRILDLWWLLIWITAQRGQSGSCKVTKAFQAAYTRTPMPRSLLERALQGHEETLQVRTRRLRSSPLRFT